MDFYDSELTIHIFPNNIQVINMNFMTYSKFWLRSKNFYLSMF